MAYRCLAMGSAVGFFLYVMKVDESVNRLTGSFNSPLLVALTYADDRRFNGPPLVSMALSGGRIFDSDNNVLKSSVVL